eukprot:7872093-Alexandrium_andersonii.AAC.1
MREHRHLDTILAEQQIPALDVVAPVLDRPLRLPRKPVALLLHISPIRGVTYSEATSGTRRRHGRSWESNPWAGRRTPRA